MLVLRALAVDGEVPLLGPRTSIGTFHHGAVYYYLLAPAAIASAVDPVAVTGEIALFGIAAVAGTWWLARLVGGPLAAAAAGLLAAISPGRHRRVHVHLEPEPRSRPRRRSRSPRRSGRAHRAGALVAGVRARRDGRHAVPRAGRGDRGAAGVGVGRRPPYAGAARAATAADPRRRRLGALAIIAAGFLPLLVVELGHGFAETRAILAYVAGGGRGGRAGCSTGSPPSGCGRSRGR